jgi:hypothetical protein
MAFITRRRREVGNGILYCSHSPMHIVAHIHKIASTHSHSSYSHRSTLSSAIKDALLSSGSMEARLGTQHLTIKALSHPPPPHNLRHVCYIPAPSRRLSHRYRCQ